MKDPCALDRRAFTVQMALALLGGATITVSGCGGGGPSSPSAPSTPPATGDEVGTISANHGHSAVITAAQLSQGGALSLDIRGGASHPHTVSLSAAEVVQIRGGQRVTTTSTVDDSHDHTVTFN